MIFFSIALLWNVVPNPLIQSFDDSSTLCADQDFELVSTLTLALFLIFALVALGLVNTVLMSIHERRWEFGILLAMGMGRLRVLGMVLTESLLLAVFSAVVGALLGFLWALYLERNGLDFTGLLPDGMDWGGLTIANACVNTVVRWRAPRPPTNFRLEDPTSGRLATRLLANGR